MMNDKFLKIFKNSVCIVGLISLLSILVLSVNTFYWADDYSFMLKIKSKGIIGNCIYGYSNWEGRFLTLGAFFQGFLIKYFRIEFITFVWSSLFLTSGLLMIKIIFYELNSVIFNKINYYLIAISLAILLWLGAYFHVAETVYWATGGIYSFFLLQCSVWIIFYLNFQKGNFNTFQKIFFLVFCFFSGASSQNLAVAFLALIAISILLDYLKNDKTNNKWNYLFFLFIFLGVLFISIAPGNFVRMKVNGMTHFDISFYGILRGIILTLKSYIIWSRYLIILLIAAILILGYSLNKAIKFNFKNIIIFPNTKTKFILFLETYKWLIVASSTILPFILALSLVSPRTSIFFMYFLIIFSVTFFYKIIFNTTNNNINAINNINFLLVVLGLFLINLSVTITDYNSGKILKSTIVLRENKLKNARNKEVTIKLIDKNLVNHCYIFTDFQLHEINNTKWIRERQEEYFGIKKITVVE